MNYGEVLVNAWKTIWKHKVLWIFGLLAGLGSGGSGSSGNPGGGGSAGSRTTPSNGDMPNLDFAGFGAQLTSWVQNNWWVLVVGVVLVMVLIVAVIILGTYGRIGLARGAWQGDEGAARLTFSGLFTESGRYFWRVLLLAGLVILVSILFAVVVGIPTAIIGAVTLGIGIVCLLPFFCVLGIAAWLAQIVIRLAIIAIVNEDLGVMAGLERAWGLARSHVAVGIVMGLVLGIGGGVMNFLIALPFLAALLPLVPLMFNQTAETVRTSLIATGVVFCLYLPVAIFLSGVVEAYVGTAWTLTFRRLSGRARAVSEVVAL